MRLQRKHRVAPLIVSLLVFAATAASVMGQTTKGPIYTDLLSALRNSGLDLEQTVKMEPVSYDRSQNVAVYRFSSRSDSRMVQVASKMDPFVEPVEPPMSEAERVHAAAVATDLAESAAIRGLQSDGSKGAGLKGIVIGSVYSGRCDLALYDFANLSSEVFRTNLDFNNLSKVSGVNDRASSLRTYCSPAVVFQHKERFGFSLYVPANTTINDLATEGLNNQISSHFIVCD